jgi:hypothetical protein
VKPFGRGSSYAISEDSWKDAAFDTPSDELALQWSDTALTHVSAVQCKLGYPRPSKPQLFVFRVTLSATTNVAGDKITFRGPVVGNGRDAGWICFRVARSVEALGGEAECSNPGSAIRTDTGLRFNGSLQCTNKITSESMLTIDWDEPSNQRYMSAVYCPESGSTIHLPSLISLVEDKMTTSPSSLDALTENIPVGRTIAFYGEEKQWMCFRSSESPSTLQLDPSCGPRGASTDDRPLAMGASFNLQICSNFFLPGSTPGPKVELAWGKRSYGAVGQVVNTSQFFLGDTEPAIEGYFKDMYITIDSEQRKIVSYTAERMVQIDEDLSNVPVGENYYIDSRVAGGGANKGSVNGNNLTLDNNLSELKGLSLVGFKIAVQKADGSTNWEVHTVSSVNGTTLTLNTAVALSSNDRVNIAYINRSEDLVSKAADLSWNLLEWKGAVFSAVRCRYVGDSHYATQRWQINAS